MAGNAKQFVLTDASQIGTADIKRELGLTLSQTQYTNRLSALMEPGTYAANRKAALDVVTSEVEIAFQKAFSRYSNAGLPSEDCRRRAMEAA